MTLSIVYIIQSDSAVSLRIVVTLHYFMYRPGLWHCYYSKALFIAPDPTQPNYEQSLKALIVKSVDELKHSE